MLSSKRSLFSKSVVFRTDEKSLARSFRSRVRQEERLNDVILLPDQGPTALIGVGLPTVTPDRVKNGLCQLESL
tara:strand:- start:58060 stop:58281 length:222 start_codon:yes stop_codon:yes gene_type:complete